MQFLCVSCGLFGRKETIGCLRTLNDLWWRWSKHSWNHYMSGWCFWAVILFLVFWTSLIAVFFFNFSALLVDMAKRVIIFWPDPTRKIPDLNPIFFYPKQKRVDPWLDPCFLRVNPTRPEPFFKLFFFGKKNSKIKTILV